MPCLCSTSYSESPKSSPTGPTTRTSQKKLAASEKCTAEPPSMRSRSPKGVFTESNAIDPTTTRLIGGADYLASPAGVGEGRHMSPRAILLPIALVALALAPSAQGGGGGFGVSPSVKSFQVGTGGKPQVAVDANGTAHVVWQVTVSAPDQ